ncbi:hypothetical protein D1872_212310 [compost metagenome]
MSRTLVAAAGQSFAVVHKMRAPALVFVHFHAEPSAGQAGDLLAVLDLNLHRFVDMLGEFRPLRQPAAVMDQFHRNYVGHRRSVVDCQNRGVERVAAGDDFFARGQYGQLLRRGSYAAYLHRIVQGYSRSYVPISIRKFHPCSSTCLYLYFLSCIALSTVQRPAYRPAPARHLSAPGPSRRSPDW